MHCLIGARQEDSELTALPQWVSAARALLCTGNASAPAPAQVRASTHAFSQSLTDVSLCACLSEPGGEHQYGRL